TDAPALVDSSALATLRGLGSLSLTKTGIINLDALSGMQQLEQLELLSNPALTQIDGVSNVAGLRTFTVSDNVALRRLPTFVNVAGADCEQCPGLEGLDVSDNPLLEAGPSLPAVETAGSVRIANNPALSSFSGLAALRTVYALEVSNNASLRAL